MYLLFKHFQNLIRRHLIIHFIYLGGRRAAVTKACDVNQLLFINILIFITLVTRQSAALSSATQPVVSKIQRNDGNEVILY